MKLKKTMEEMDLSAPLRAQVDDFLRFKHRVGAEHSQPQEQFLGDLSPVLRRKVSVELHAPTIRAVPIFKKVSERFVAKVCEMIYPHYYQPYDYVYEKGEPSGCMFFIFSGSVCVIEQTATTREDDYYHLQRGSFFGEAGLLTNTKRETAAQCMTHACLYILDKVQLTRLLEEFPEYAGPMANAEKLRRMGMSWGVGRVLFRSSYLIIGLRN
jgi:hypothetical protein